MRSWDPENVDGGMNGIDLALFHGNIRTFDMIVALRKMIPLHRSQNYVSHAWLDDEELVAQARDWCLSRSHFHRANTYTERYRWSGDVSTDSEEEEITRMRAIDFARRDGRRDVSSEHLQREWRECELDDLEPTGSRYNGTLDSDGDW